MTPLILAAILMPFIIFADLSWKASSGERFVVEAHVSSEKTSVTEPLEVKLLLTYPTAYSVNRDQLTDNLLSHPTIELPAFKLISVQEKKAVADGTYNHEITWLLQPEMEGKFHLSFFEIGFTPSKESKLEQVNLISNLFEINVLTIGKVPAGLQASNVLPLSNTYPIEIDPNIYRQHVANEELERQEADRNVQIFRERAFPWVVCLLIPLLALFAYLVRLSPVRIQPSITAKHMREKVLQEIVQLQDAAMPPNLLYEKLDHILREYFQFQYDIAAPKLTPKEFIQELKGRSELSEEMKNDVIQFIENSEMVKFAKEQPTSEECFKAKMTVLQLIQ